MILYSYWQITDSETIRLVTESLLARAEHYKEIAFYFKEALKIDVEVSLWHFYTNAVLKSTHLGSLTRDTEDMLPCDVGFEVEEKITKVLTRLALKEHPPLLLELSQWISPTYRSEQILLPVGLELWEKDKNLFLTLPLASSSAGLIYSQKIKQLNAYEFWHHFEIEECPINEPSSNLGSLSKSS